MASKWFVAVGYTLFGLLFVVSSVLLIGMDEFPTPSALVQFVGGGLLIVVGVGTALDSRPIKTGSRTRGLATVGSLMAVLGLAGQFLLL